MKTKIETIDGENDSLDRLLYSRQEKITHLYAIVL